ncbi:ABC transporter ATP-binding protein [Prochlorococcus sp. MIT 1300]|uniref:ABC transporter ATP-binding protein n=1 Tax=Prochlorococcus sp. MIT 1300 TaxID=3096218 RepID=UPI002A75A286|nr:ATP-binding cassette domain-containing protein [Prochlorococcus sp. MIT 1300]
MTQESPWLEIENAEVFHRGKRIFKDISLSLMRGEQTIVLGPNGAGKSTLIRLIRREIYPVSKSSTIFRMFGSDEINLTELRKRVGVLSQEIDKRMNPRILTPDVISSGFYGSLGIRKNQIPSPAQRERTDELIESMRLTKLCKLNFGELSDGQKKRVLLARALVHDPEIIVLDEPTSGLDLSAKYSLLQILDRLSKNGKTLLIVTHQIDNVIKTINKIVFMKEGKVNNVGSVKEKINSEELSELFNIPLKVVSANGYWQVLPDH